MASRYYATHRIATGDPYGEGIVMDRETGIAVAVCPHRHRSRRYGKILADGQRRRVNAGTFAQRCAEKMLQRFLRARSEESDNA